MCSPTVDAHANVLSCLLAILHVSQCMIYMPGVMCVHADGPQRQRQDNSAGCVNTTSPADAAHLRLFLQHNN